MKIDTRWFQQKIEARFGSQRKMAPRLRGRNGKRMEQSVLCKILSGDRDMLFSEAVQISEKLGVPLEELAKRMGF